MNYDLLIDLHKTNQRQGPGSQKHTQKAMELAGLMDKSEPLKIADIGCGTGSSTLILAENLNATITAVDLFDDFLEILMTNATKGGVDHKIKTMTRSMEDLPFEEGSLDAIWSEGAIYNMGFEKGIAHFKPFLKPHGILAISEITWLTNQRPKKIQTYWQTHYPQIGTAWEKIKILEDQGLILKGYFPLPQSSWIENYYMPLENSFHNFMARHNNNDAQLIVDEQRAEIALYKKYGQYYSYGFYIAQTI